MKTYLVTGAGRGLGFELSRQLIERGDRVVACVRVPQKAEKFAALDTQSGGQVHVIGQDVDDEYSIRQSAEKAASLVGTIDVLICNAAILRGDFPLTTTSQTMMETYRTNTVGPVLVTQAFLPLLAKSSQPKIAIISSEAGSLERYQNSVHIFSYACTKAALNMAARCLAAQLSEKKVSVVTLHPGWLQTDMGGKGATVPTALSARGIIRIIDTLDISSTGRFVDFEGNEVPW